MGEVMSKVLFTSLLLIFSLLLFGCGKSILTDINSGIINTSSVNKSANGGIKGYAILKNQTDHSGTLIEISGTNISTITDSFGFYEISNIPEGPVTINYSPPGCNIITTENIISSGVMINIPNLYLSPVTNNAESSSNITSLFGNINGIVKLNGILKEDIIVSIKGSPYKVKTDFNGYYSFLNIPSGNYTLIYNFRDYVTKTQEVPVITRAITNAITIDLITGTGKVIGNAKLENEPDNNGIIISINGTPFTAITDSKGNYIIEYIPTGSYDITISKPGYSTENIIGIYIQGNTETTISPVTLPIYYYDLSSVISGMVYSMSYLNGQLYINADDKLFIVPTSNPDSPTENPIITSSNCYSMVKQYDHKNNTWKLTGYYDEDFDGLCDHKYTITSNISNNISEWLGESITPIYADALCGSPKNEKNILYYDNMSCNFVELNEKSSEIKNIFPVTQNGIVGIDFFDNKFVACNTNTIFEYNDNFMLTRSIIIESTDIIDTAYDGTYIWVIDDNRRLYRIRDS